MRLECSALKSLLAAFLPNSCDQVLVDGKAQRELGEASVARVMGTPLREGDGEQGESLLVYGAGLHAMVLVFAGQLARVELWRKDLVVPAAQ